MNNISTILEDNKRLKENNVNTIDNTNKLKIKHKE